MTDTSCAAPISRIFCEVVMVVVFAKQAVHATSPGGLGLGRYDLASNEFTNCVYSTHTCVEIADSVETEDQESRAVRL